MARINREPKWDSDPRRKHLVRLFMAEPALADYAEDLAEGAAINLWKLAQDYIENGRSVIPHHIFDSVVAKPKLIEAKLVRAEAGGYYVVGSSEHLAWLEKKRENAAKGGRSKSEAKTKTLKQNRSRAEAEPKQDRSTAEANPKPLPLPTSSSSSSSSSNFPPGGAASAPEALNTEYESQGSGVIAAYHRLWKLHHEDRAPLMPKDYSLLKGVEKQVGTRRAVELVEAYFKMPDGWFAHKAHDVVSFQQNLAKVASYLAKGQTVTVTQARQAEKTHANANAAKAAADYYRNQGGKP